MQVEESEEWNETGSEVETWVRWFDNLGILGKQRHRPTLMCSGT